MSSKLKGGLVTVEDMLLKLSNSQNAKLSSITLLFRVVGGWLYELKIRLNSAFNSVEIEVEVEAELGKNSRMNEGSLTDFDPVQPINVQQFIAS